MIQINLFNSSQYKYRLPIVKAALNELANIKDDNKKEIELYVYCHEIDNTIWEEILYEVATNGINVSLVSMPNDEYSEKMKIAQQTKAEYFCKWDDDVFINRYVWDYMIENVSILEDSSVSVLAPTLSNGMPTVELFIRDFLTKSEIDQVHSIFLRDNIDSNIFGCNYDLIYTYISSSIEWDGDTYWNVMNEHNPTTNRNVPWYYKIVKGVHPARFSYDYNMFVAKHAVEHKDVIMKDSNFFLEKYTTPYFCNNLFISKTSFYQEAQKLFFDHWDEGQLTMYANKTNKSPIYIRNCYGIHMAYGCTDRQKEIETYYLTNLFSQL